MQHQRRRRSKAAAAELGARPQRGGRRGPGTLTWSPDGQLLATVNENMPHAIWIWDLGSAELAAVLCQVGPVRALAWSPAGRSLAAVAGGGRLYLWSPAGASVVHVPLGGFQATGVSWAQGGEALALHGRESFCCGYVGT
ncbi:hypothetical protein MNEG_13807 [Monoraphidium neglectum]|uniref:Anaphase-promoting complex subunit 4 WD40 domain-containing protein n=1 Tax=Monoraphidium neglectum TaxID=145388 RepID=A0A0D2LXG1_9CHLO|nr:hypothetical protein MNEG_13807 [Monoraphidium neglectum]KIY94156.1 hypothetical protein MNEG_13807 [Monoraphidium neglectum]|eukprot:XP_013893176.1 hypothetical protein MNEG_13807 [Monoraphidium neglectum]